ncbi:biotin attachment protein [Alicyclobacillus curvatus]|jgi:2-oxoisovalerate dehydrogenase E2 component (dihydrolipoyl transacylase)|nr:biotin attachment protein [Alicyclobacillus curvatus]
MADMKIPQLGESVTDGLLASWLKQAGDHVDVDEPLLEVTTDKVNVEIPSEYSGVIEEILVPEGSKVEIGTVVCRIRSDAE